MIKNYFLIGIRNLRKHFSYSLINIFGLGLGLATCLLLVSWILHELSYDRFHQHAARIYRSSLEMSFGGQTFKTAVSPTALLPALRQYPEVIDGVRVYNPAAWNPFIVRKDDKLFQEKHFYFADSTFFNVFSFKLLSGNPATALRQPYTVILTKSSAVKYFGTEDPVGKTLSINGTREYTVTGVMEDVPSNSFLQFDFLAPFSSLRQGQEEPIWWSANYQTFVIVDENADVPSLSKKTDEHVRQALGQQLSGPGDYVHYNFMKLTDIHLRSEYENEFEVVGDIRYVYIFSAIAILILLIACINYVNLATARAADRAREVGIRKVVGAARKQLFGQFLGESVMITLLSFLLAFFAAQILLPIFSAVVGKNISPEVFYSPAFLGLGAAMLIAISLFSGAYPAFVITSFKPVNILKGNFKFSGKGIWLRQSLVVTQFAISIVLIMGTLVILNQLDFIQNKKLGYKKDNIVVLPLDRKTEEVYGQVRNEFMRSGFVSQMGLATESPTRIQGGYGFNIEGNSGNNVLLTAVAADTGLLPALEMEILEGRNFNDADMKRMEKDTFYAFVVNETLLKTIYLDPDKAIGTRATLSGREGEIVGVISDFHFSSLHTPIGPLVIFNERVYNHMFVKLRDGDPREALARLREITATLTPHKPFEYQFLDSQYDALYSSEQRMGTIFTTFAALAILIACMGLLGLVSFSAAQKTKEIGIRKVMGATAASIVLLITRDFTRLVFIAILIGIPLAYWVMTEWLADFAYRTNIGMLPIVAASLLCIIIAFGTAGFQAIKAALVDPAKTLRNE